jgi:hypothetical protein
MHIGISYKDFATKAEDHPVAEIVALYLNDCLGARYYGPGMTSVHIAILDHPRKGRTAKQTRRYKGSFAEHVLLEVLVDWDGDRKRTIESFLKVMQLVRDAIDQSKPCWEGEFRLSEFQRDFDAALADVPETKPELQTLFADVKGLRQRIGIQWQRADEIHRRENPRACETRLVGVRVYPRGRLEKQLEPFASQYGQLFAGCLRQLGLKCPGYQEIYINVGDSPDEARSDPAAIEEWHENAFAVVSLDDYNAADEEGKQQILLNAYSKALRELAEIDHLDREVIEAATAQIAETGLQTELVYGAKQNDEYDARILYTLQGKEPGAQTDSRPRGHALFLEGDEYPLFRLSVKRLSDGAVAERELGRFNLWWLPYRFGKLRLMKREVRIEARKGERADVALKDAPRVIAFRYDELFA